MLSRTIRNALAKPPRRPLQLHSALGHQHSTQRSKSSFQTRQTIPPTVDDISLISLFDQPQAGLRSSSISPTGLFGHPSITHPNALISLADATLVRAQLLTKRIHEAPQSRAELFQVVKNLDRLSDLLCGVIDLAELVRNAHPDRVWVEAANHAYESLCEFMNVLNTNVGLYQVRRDHTIFCPGHSYDSITTGAQSCSFGSSCR